MVGRKILDLQILLYIYRTVYIYSYVFHDQVMKKTLLTNIYMQVAKHFCNIKGGWLEEKHDKKNG